MSRWSTIFPGAQSNRVDFLIDGEETYQNYLEAFATARTKEHFIYITSWMLNMEFEMLLGNDESTLKYALRAAARRGVDICILIWNNPIYINSNKRAIKLVEEINSDLDPPHDRLIRISLDKANYAHPASKSHLKTIAGIVNVLNKMFKYIAVPKNPFRTYKEYIDFALKMDSIGSHHEKNIVVYGNKGLIGYCGGLDINPNRVRHLKEKSKTILQPDLHDVQCRFEGPAALALLHKVLDRFSYNPPTSHWVLIGQSMDKTSSPSGPSSLLVGTYNHPSISNIRDRSLRDSYYLVLKNASKYIYLDCQYLVNYKVAEMLNAKVKEKDFQLLIINIQLPGLASDLLMPVRKRAKFIDLVNRGLSEEQKKKVAVLMINQKYLKNRGHGAMHAKTLIADDEIAIVGSANVNRRSFTHDSETSLLVFDESYSINNMVKKFRQRLWSEFMESPHFPFTDLTWESLVASARDKNRQCAVTDYDSSGYTDLDEYAKQIVQISGLALKTVSLGVEAGQMLLDNQDFDADVREPIFTAIPFSLLWTIDFVSEAIWNFAVEPDGDRK